MYIKKFGLQIFNNLQRFIFLGSLGRSWYQNVANHLRIMGKIRILRGGAIFGKKFSKNYFKIKGFSQFFSLRGKLSTFSHRIENPPRWALDLIETNILVYRTPGIVWWTFSEKMAKNLPFWNFFTFRGRISRNLGYVDGIRHWNGRENCCEHFEWSLIEFGWVIIVIWPFLGHFLVKSLCRQGQIFNFLVELP